MKNLEIQLTLRADGPSEPSVTFHRTHWLSGDKKTNITILRVEVYLWSFYLIFCKVSSHGPTALNTTDHERCARRGRHASGTRRVRVSRTARLRDKAVAACVGLYFVHSGRTTTIKTQVLKIINDWVKARQRSIKTDLSTIISLVTDHSS